MNRFFTFYDQDHQPIFQGYFTGVFDALDFLEIRGLEATYLGWA